MARNPASVCANSRKSLDIARTGRVGTDDGGAGRFLKIRSVCVDESAFWNSRAAWDVELQGG